MTTIRNKKALRDYLEAFDRRIEQDFYDPPTSGFRWWFMGGVTAVCLLAALFI
jgi:hypothetical protein